MMQPLALVFYERLLPGTQLVNRLHDLHYRVQTVEDVNTLPAAARKSLPMVALLDLDCARGNPLAVIQLLKAADDTSHLPIIAFSANEHVNAGGIVQEAGATVIAQDQALLNHLPQLLEQALRVE